MQYQCPFYISEKEVEEALTIIVHYFERKDGAVAQSTVDRGLSHTYEFFRKGCHHPLVLANKTIRLLEAERIRPKAA